MTQIKIGAVTYKSKSAAIRAALKRFKNKSKAEIAKMVGVSPACVTIVNKNAGEIRPTRNYNMVTA